MDAEAATMTTNCGRRLVTGRFRVPTAAIDRVVLRVDPDSGGCGTVWASLTADEALTLARALIAQARAISPR